MTDDWDSCDYPTHPMPLTVTLKASTPILDSKALRFLAQEVIDRWFDPTQVLPTTIDPRTVMVVCFDTNTTNAFWWLLHKDLADLEVADGQVLTY